MEVEIKSLKVLRDGRDLHVKVKLRPDYFFSPAGRFNYLVQRIGLAKAQQRPASGY